MTDERIVIGVITPGPEGEPPVFKVVRSDYELRDAGPNVRPCDHGAFVLDTKWNTVTCGKCHQTVDAFAALLLFATWGEKWKLARYMAQDAERRLHVANLRRLAALRSISPTSREQAQTAIRESGRLDVAELNAIARKIEREYHAIRSGKRQSKAGA